MYCGDYIAGAPRELGLSPGNNIALGEVQLWAVIAYELV